MASKTWLAVSLMLLIWFTYIKWFAPMPPPPVVQNPVVATDGKTESSLGNSKEAGATNSSASATGAAATSGLFEPIPMGDTSKVGAAPALSNAKLELVFSANGGKIAEAQLPRFRERIDPKSHFVSPVSNQDSTLNLATLFTDPQLASFARAPYQVEQIGNKVSFRRTDNGISVSKDYTLSERSNFLDVTYKITVPSGDKKDWGNLIIPIGHNSTHSFDAQLPLLSWEAVFYQNDAITRKTSEQIGKADETTSQGSTSWAAFGNRYFSTVVINQAQQINPDVVFKKTDGFLGTYLRYPIAFKQGQNEILYTFQFYIGPKEYSELSKVPGLKKLIDYGTFSFFAFPLLEVLQFFNRFIHNYGLAIILLTLLVRALFYPLSIKSMKSMKAMQKLQPQIAAIKEKHKDDPKKLNEEQMALFKTHKVNPAGGCLPMLVQLPVFIALYAVLGNSIELFHAPFFGWIQDLSTKDPFYIYPGLMGIAMFVQQKMTPNAGMDPAQQKIMLLMPVMFTFMMINLPSGLTLYIFVSTLLGIVQQMALRDKSVTVPQPA